jgi:autotransporter-associated beta strand protein
LIANGGKIMLTAQAANSVISSVINTTGLVQANSVKLSDGTVLLGNINIDGGNQGTVTVGGTVTASGLEPGTSGGHIRVWGGNTIIDESANLLATGDMDGGFIETSGEKLNITYGAKVSTRGINGSTGTWLLDPLDFVISNAGGGTISPSTIVDALNTSNLTITTSSGSQLPTTYNGTSTTNCSDCSGSNGDISINNALNLATNSASWSAHTLTLNAYNNININADITGTGTSSIIFNSGVANTTANGTSTGVINLAANIYTGGSQSFNNSIIISKPALTLSASNITVSGNITLSLDTLITALNLVTNSTTIKSQITGNISGYLSLLKSGVGSLTLSGQNTYSYGTYIQSGTLVAGVSDSITDTIVTSPLGVGSIYISPGATLDLAGNSLQHPSNSYIGIYIGSSESTSAGNVINSISSSTSNIAYKVEFDGYGAIGGVGDINISGNICCAAGSIPVSVLSKTGIGTLTLSGVNNYFGGTQVLEGVLQASGSSTTPFGSGAITVSNSGALDVTGLSNVINAVSISGDGGGGGALRVKSGTSVFSQSLTLDANSTIGLGASANLKLNNTTSALIASSGQTLTIEDIGVANSAATPQLEISGLLGFATHTTGSVAQTIVNPNSSSFPFPADFNLIKGDGSLFGPTVKFSYAGTSYVSGNIYGTGNFTLSSGSTLIRSGLTQSSTAYLDGIDKIDGTLDLNGQNTILSLLQGSGVIQSSSVSTSPVSLFTGEGGNSTYDGKINGNIALYKYGGGYLKLSNGLSTYSGGSYSYLGDLVAEADSVSSGSSVISGPFGTGSITVIGGGVVTTGFTIANTKINNCSTCTKIDTTTLNKVNNSVTQVNSSVSSAVAGAIKAPPPPQNTNSVAGSTTSPPPSTQTAANSPALQAPVAPGNTPPLGGETSPPPPPQGALNAPPPPPSAGGDSSAPLPSQTASNSLPPPPPLGGETSAPPAGQAASNSPPPPLASNSAPAPSTAPGPVLATATAIPPPPPPIGASTSAPTPLGPRSVTGGGTVAVAPTVASPAASASTAVTPPPPSPVATVKPPTPKDSADTGDKTLASVSPPATVQPASQSVRSSAKITTVQISPTVSLQKVAPATTPASAQMNIRLSASGNSASW